MTKSTPPEAQKPTPDPEVGRIRMAHASMQFKDTAKQMRHDVNVLFTREYDWITGTEAGPGSGDLEDILRFAAREQGYRFFQPDGTDGWIAVRRDFMANPADFERAFRPVIPSSRDIEATGTQVPTRFGQKGVVSVGFTPADLRLAPHIHVATSHYLHHSHTSPVLRRWNERLARALAEWAREQGRGSALAFYGGDQNMNDERLDTFFDTETFTSLGDELKRWQNTGHGPIDVIATSDQDSRVVARRYTVLDDREEFLHMDHFLLEGVVDVRLLPEDVARRDTDWPCPGC